jgi:hypothetical protein
LQNNKRELAKAALSGDAVKNVMKLTLNDIMGQSCESPRLSHTDNIPELFKRQPRQGDVDDDDDEDQD